MENILRITAIGDFHLNPFNEFSRSIDSNGDTEFSKDLIETAKFVRKQFLKHKSKFLLVNGDLTHTPGVLNSPTLNLIQKVESVWGKDVPRVYNIGNHDLDNKVGLHNLMLHNMVDGVEKVAEPSTVNLHSGIFILPFTYSIEEQEGLLRSVPDGSVVVVHTPIIGMHMGANVPESHGIPVENFRRFRLTIASHYHLPQIHYADGTCEIVNNVSAMCNNDVPFGTLVMMGTPHPHTFSDSNSKYGVWNFDIGNKKISMEMVENLNAKQFYSIKPGNLGELQSFINNVPHNSYVSVQVPEEMFEKFQNINFQSIFPNSKVRKLKTERTINKDVYEDTTGNIKKVVSDFLDTKEDLLYPKESILEFVSPIIDSAPMEVKIGGNVVFKSLKIKNFLSWGEAEVKFEDSGLFLVSGVNFDASSSDSNGSGKTSLLESIVWCVYGTPFRDIDSKDSVIRNGSKDGCYVEVVFSNESGTFKVSRYRKHKELGTGVSIAKYEDKDPHYGKDWVFWKDISRGSLANTDAQIIDVIGLPYDLFNTVTYFSSHNETRFTLLGDVDRKKFLAKLFDLGRYEHLRGAVKTENNEASSKVNSLSQKVSQQEQMIERLEAQRDKEKENVEKERAENEAKITATQQKLSELEKNLPELVTNLRSAQDSLVETQESKSKLAVEISKINSEKTILVSSLASVDRAIDSAVTSKGKVENKIKSKKNEIDNIATSCPTCDQPIDQLKINEIRSEYVKQLEELTIELLDFEAIIEEEQEKKKENKQRILDFEVKNEETIVESTRVEKELIDRNAAVARCNSLLASARSTIESLERDLFSYKTVEFGKAVDVLQKTINEERRNEISYKDDLKCASEKLQFLSFLFNLFGGKELISFVMESGVREFNSYLSEISREICSGDYSIQLDTVKELKSGGEDNKITIKYTTNAGSYGASSDGEKRKADISIFLAFNSLSQSMGRGSTNILVADEALDSLDPTASKIVATTLADFATVNGKSIFLISHSDYVTPFVSRVLTVEKSEGISRIKNGFNI